jgi:hypothetical protein
MATVYMNQLLTQIIRPALLLEPADGRPTMQTKMPADVLASLPLIVAKGTAGSEIDPRFGADAVVAQVDVYAAGETEAQKWAAWVRDLLVECWEKQTVFDAGYISYLTTVVVPWELPDSFVPDGVVRYLAEYRLNVRPKPPG